MAQSRPTPSFTQIYEFHRALEEEISIAAENGLIIYPAAVAAKLLIEHPAPGLKAAEIDLAIIIAAGRAGVPVQSD
jgi:hypothetical protein